MEMFDKKNIDVLLDFRPDVLCDNSMFTGKGGALLWFILSGKDEYRFSLKSSLNILQVKAQNLLCLERIKFLFLKFIYHYLKQ